MREEEEAGRKSFSKPLSHFFLPSSASCSFAHCSLSLESIVCLFLSEKNTKLFPHVRAPRSARAAELRHGGPERLRGTWRRRHRRGPRGARLPRPRRWHRRRWLVLSRRPERRRWRGRGRRGQGQGPHPPRDFVGQVEEPARESNPWRRGGARGEFFLSRKRRNGWSKRIAIDFSLASSRAPTLSILSSSSSLFFSCSSSAFLSAATRPFRCRRSIRGSGRGEMRAAERDKRIAKEQTLEKTKKKKEASIGLSSLATGRRALPPPSFSWDSFSPFLSRLEFGEHSSSVSMVSESA